MKTIEAEVISPGGEKSNPQTAVAVRETNTAVDRALPIEELRANLGYIKEVMQTVMKEGQDYGKVPGCGDKPGLFQPGAQKLCMTFQLTDEVKEERVNDLPNYHREYSFVVRLVSRTGRTWEGVGTCSTLEGKYRYRKAERRCPTCGKTTIIKGKAEYGGGWICFAKKGGCGAKFADNEPAITDQPGGMVENDNPADYWNTVRKMAFKRALVHASINATNTSELWSQDLEDLPQSAPEPEPPPVSKPSPPPAAKPKPPTNIDKPALAPTDESRNRMLTELQAHPGQVNRDIVTEYAIKAGLILDNESLEEIPLMWVPASRGQMKALAAKVTEFSAGGAAERAFPPNPSQAAAPEPKPVQQPATKPAAPAEDDWFMRFIVPIPRKGQKRDDYLKNPDTIGSLYEARHGDDADSQDARQRLWGFVTNYEPKPWTKKDGTVVPPSDTDRKFREALDAFSDWFEKNHPDEKL